MESSSLKKIFFCTKNELKRKTLIKKNIMKDPFFKGNSCSRDAICQEIFANFFARSNRGNLRDRGLIIISIPYFFYTISTVLLNFLYPKVCLVW